MARLKIRVQKPMSDKKQKETTKGIEQEERRKVGEQTKRKTLEKKEYSKEVKQEKKRKIDEQTSRKTLEKKEDNKEVEQKRRKKVSEQTKRKRLEKKEDDVVEKKKNVHCKKQDKESTVEDREDRDFVTQCRPQGLYDLVQTLTEKQKNDVKSIGFGGLLKLSIKSIPTKMLKWLVNNFNGTNQMMKIDNNKSFVVTADDICDIFLLPRQEGKDVLELSRKESLDIMVGWKEKYGIGDDIPLSTLKNLIQERLKEGGDDFKRFFVLFSLSSFLTPTTNRLVDFNALKSLVDVDKIVEFDWCSYILKRLCKVVNKYNSSAHIKNFSGCVVVLQILYFHRLKWQGITEPSTLPLIQHWSNEKLRKRIKEEASAGVFGQGEWVLETYPVSLKAKAKKEAYGEKFHENISESEIKKSDEKVDESSRFIKFHLPEGELSDAEIHELAKDDVHETFLLLKRDMAVITNVHMKRLDKLKKKIKEKQAASSSSQSPALYESQKFFSDSNLHHYIDEAVENFKKMKNLADAMPSFDLLTPEQEEAENEENEENLNDVEEIIEAIASIGSKREKQVAREKADCLDEPWPIDEDVGYVSRFITGNKKLLAEMNRREKDIIDYCFFHDESTRIKDDVFSHAGIHTISLEDMRTLNAHEMISTNIIDAWCLMLNKREAVEHQPKRYYFDLQHSLFLRNVLNNEDGNQKNEESMRRCWGHWMEIQVNKKDLSMVDMIFVPIHINMHFIAAVINFKDEKVQYLDNRKYVDASDYVEAVEIVRKQISIFLQGKHHSKAEALLSYEFENVALSWQTNKNDVDCGVFLMHHMEYFEGKLYSTPDLGKALVRRALRAEICARIVLSDVNELRLDTLQRVIHFKLNRPHLRNVNAEKKKKKKQKK